MTHLSEEEKKEICAAFDEKFGSNGTERNCDSIGRFAGCDDCRENIELREEHKAHLLATIEADREKMAAKVITDLYEARASVITPKSLREKQDLHDLLKYNFLDAIIARISEKYSVNYEDIRTEIRERHHENDLAELNHPTQ